MLVGDKFCVLFQCSAGRAEISNQRIYTNKALRVSWLKRTDKINQSYRKGAMCIEFMFFHKAFHAAGNNAFASSSQSIR